jgi:tRNA pseudouridine38-40 synthase
MNRYKAIISYDGSRFSGYQIQPTGRTVQGELEKALSTLHKGEPISVVGSGRTDAGVHAKGQVIHFDSPLPIPLEKWPKVLNGLLPTDIAVQSVQQVSLDFHARFSAMGKEYRYLVYQQKERDPFKHHYEYHYPYPLNLNAMVEASTYLIGTHDFTSFCSAKTEIEDKVRTIEQIRIWEEEKGLVFQFIGNGFLYNMVRIIVGTLLEVGSGKKYASDIPRILEGKNRELAGKTAPACGLYLWQVFYDN